MKKVIFGLLLLPSIAFGQAKTNPKDIAQKMQWFADAKLGIFIHWGIYSTGKTSESWYFHNKNIGYADYMKQMQEFTASKYNPQQWADLIKESGARYSVITTKHHDGVALWDTKEKHFDITQTPAKKDVLKPFFEALRKDGIKCGAYFSLLDWSYKDYPGFLKDSTRYKITDDYPRWNSYRTFFQNQLMEVANNYNPDLWWFDGDWEHSNEEWEAEKIRTMLLKKNPNAILNGRLQGYGDYETPEQNFPVARPKYNWWELCMTSNDNWGYRLGDTAFKTPYEVITIFADAIANGGNLLLDIGPKADGSMQPEQVHLLKELGKWNKKHAEAIFGTVGGIGAGHFYGPSTISKDSTALYLFLPGKTTGNIVVRGLENKIKRVTVVGNNSQLTPKIVGKISWSKVPGLVYIPVPESVQDEYVTVLKLELQDPIKLYAGHGGL